MTQPNQFTTVVAQEEGQDDRDFVPWVRCKDKLIIVRPLEYQASGYKTKHQDNTDVVYCDVAVLDEIRGIPAEYDPESIERKGFAAGFQFRNQAVMPGYLKGAFKRYLGATLIGTVYPGTPTKGKPPIMWRDLSQHPEAVARGGKFLAMFPEFLIPVERQFTATEPVASADPWATPAAAAPAIGPDPWASGPAASAPTPTARPAGGSTLDLIRNMGEVNHRGDPQVTDPPF